jgi:hypothetical protein
MITRGTYCRRFNRRLKEPLGGTSIATLLNQNIKDDTILIYGAPHMMLNALDPNEHLIEVPLVARPGTTAVQSASKALAKFLTPALHCLVGDHDAALGPKQLNIPQAEAEHMIELNPWLMISAGNR